MFRKEALERLSSPEHLDRLMQVVRLKDWLPLTTFSILLFLIALWSIVGRIPIMVSGQGVLIRPRRVVKFESSRTGQLKFLNVRNGQCIEKDYVLATIDPSDLKQQLQLQRNKHAQLQAQARESDRLWLQRMQQEKEELAGKTTSLQQRLRNALALTPLLKEKALNAIEQESQSVKQQLKDARELAPVLGEILTRRKKLFTQGAISQDNVLEAEQEYRSSVQIISQLKAQLKQLEVKEIEAQQQFLENLSTIKEIQAQLQEFKTRSKRLEQENREAANQRKNEIEEVKRLIARLEKQVADRSQILSPQAGCVLEITAQVGQFVNPGTRLGSIEVQEKASKIVSINYFTVKDGKRIKPGMPIHITPDTVKRERFGGLVGQVIKVSPFPVTKEGASTLVGNPEVIENLIGQKGATLEAIAQLEPDSSTFSGYKWSSSQGPQLKMSAGTTTQVWVKVEERAPITFILPILREKSGIY